MYSNDTQRPARPIRAIIFDLDGTLADTIGAICDGINQTMLAYSYPTKTYEDVRRAIGNGARLLIQRCMPEPDASNGPQVSRVLATYDMAYSQTYLHTRECYEGMVETVKELYRRGYRLAVLSNKQDTYTVGLVDQLFPDGEFEVVMGQTDLPTKPNPTVPHLIAHQLCVAPEECAMIGDSDVDIVTAKNAGMTGVGCAWGYRGRNMLLAAGAKTVVNAPRELLDLFPPVEEPCFDEPTEEVPTEPEEAESTKDAAR